VQVLSFNVKNEQVLNECQLFFIKLIKIYRKYLRQDDEKKERKISCNLSISLRLELAKTNISLRSESKKKNR
jgi:hypothetical protein